MISKITIAIALLLIHGSDLYSQQTSSDNNPPTFYRFDLDSQTKQESVVLPDQQLPNGNPYAIPIQSEFSVSIADATDSFLAKVDAAIDNIINEVTKDHPQGRALLQQQGLQINLQNLAADSDLFLKQHTPVVEGELSDISNYHLVGVVDLQPLQSEIHQRWNEVLLGKRLVQYSMIASVILIVLFLLRGNQVMRSRNTPRSILIAVNSVILLATFVALGVIAMMLEWV